MHRGNNKYTGVRTWLGSYRLFLRVEPAETALLHFNEDVSLLYLPSFLSSLGSHVSSQAARIHASPLISPRQANREGDNAFKRNATLPRGTRHARADLPRRSFDVRFAQICQREVLAKCLKMFDQVDKCRRTNKRTIDFKSYSYKRDVISFRGKVFEHSQ